MSVAWAMPRKKKAKLPQIHVLGWLRGKGHPSTYLQWAFKKAKSWAILGEIETGKSSLGETIGSNYAETGCSIIDLYGSRDNEGLAWLRSPYKKNVLLLKGNSVQIDFNDADVMNALDFKLRHLDEYKVIISPASFYSSIREEWYAIGKLTEELWHRTFWDYPVAMIIREASNLLYSRLSLGDTQALAKTYMAYFVREMRHVGFSIILDTIRWRSIDINFRSVDYLIIKAQGIEGLSGSGLGFVYAYVDPRSLQKMGPAGAIVVCRRGPMGIFESDLPFWHKLEHENMLAIFGLHPEYKPLPNYGEKGFQRVGDFEHVRIIKMRIEKKSERGRALSMEKIAKILSRSPRTVQKHLEAHNNMVLGVGECDKCARVNAPYAKQEC